MGGTGRTGQVNGFFVVAEKFLLGKLAFSANKQNRVGPSLQSRSIVFTLFRLQFIQRILNDIEEKGN